MAYKLIIDGAVVENMLHGPDGIVGRYMIGKSQIVQNAAIVQCPKRTGKLSQSIVKRFYDSDVGFTVVIAALQPYALYVHEGTKAHVIYPKKAKALRWYGADGNPIFATKVNHPGTKANHFLTDQMYLFFEPFPI
jgi:hypothetical protein